MRIDGAARVLLREYRSGALAVSRKAKPMQRERIAHELAGVAEMLDEMPPGCRDAYARLTVANIRHGLETGALIACVGSSRRSLPRWRQRPAIRWR